MNILNLDKLTITSKRSLVLGGVTYPIDGMTVANFVETTIVAQKNEGADVLQQVELTMELVSLLVPGITKEMLLRVPLEQLKAIVAYARGDDDVPGSEMADAITDGEEKK